MTLTTTLTNNKHVLITGGNQGIGFHTALLLAKKGNYNITLCCRNKERAEYAVQKIIERNNNCQVNWLLLDLASLKSVKNLIENIKKQKILFDIIILNAGILLPKERLTEDGLETTFQVNYLGHFLLINGIIKHQSLKRQIKIITITSVMCRFIGNIFPLEKEADKWLEMFQTAKSWKAYALSKFATAMLSHYLNSLEGVSSVTIHPGNVRTQMSDGLVNQKLRKFLFFLRRILIEPEEAALNVINCAEQNIESGMYWNVNKKRKLPKSVTKQKNLEAFIKMSREIINDFN
uniref:SDR family NAD(P)-dependent oxidoreductase n=1 Tax=Meloidogyne hapla TaxID=6305 RepID=A0A1I8BCQ4_MELHA